MSSWWILGGSCFVLSQVVAAMSVSGADFQSQVSCIKTGVDKQLGQVREQIPQSRTVGRFSSDLEDLRRRVGARDLEAFIDLGADASIPDSILGKYDSRTIGEMIAVRLHVRAENGVNV